MALFRILFLLLFIPLSCVAVDQPRQTPSPLPDCPFAPITTDAAIDFMTHTQYNLELQGNDGSFGRQLTRRQESAPDQPDPLGTFPSSETDNARFQFSLHRTLSMCANCV